jgi:magnesium-transporting ATPase (P-type)
MISFISNTNGLPTQFPPLLFIVLISMIKDGYENYKHYKSDMEENNRTVKVLDKNGALVEKFWADLRIGDVIKIAEDEPFPADVMILFTSDPKGISSPFSQPRPVLYRDQEPRR